MECYLKGKVTVQGSKLAYFRSEIDTFTMIVYKFPVYREVNKHAIANLKFSSPGKGNNWNFSVFADNF